MKPALKTRAIVLRRTNYGEADRIVQLLTPDHGKVGVMARGARKEKSKLAGGIELFSVSEVMVRQGRGELGTLSSVRLQHFYSNIMEDYDRLQFGYEALKTINRLAEYLHEPSLFDALQEVLVSLDILKIDLRIIKAWFYLQVADVQGRGLNLSRDQVGHPLVDDTTYIFDIADMVFVRSERGTFTSNHLKVLKLLRLKTPQVVARISGLEQYLDDCTSLAHAVAE